MTYYFDRFAQKYGRDRDNNFAVACYEMNSISELRSAASQGPDPTDLKNWGITPEEWRDAIAAAIKERTRNSDWLCWRRDLGLTQQQAADQLGVSKRHYQGIEWGDRTPSQSVINLAAKLECSQ